MTERALHCCSVADTTYSIGSSSLDFDKMTLFFIIGRFGDFLANGGTLSELELRVLYMSGWCHFDNDATSKINDVFFEHGRLLYSLPLILLTT